VTAYFALACAAFVLLSMALAAEAPAPPAPAGNAAEMAKVLTPDAKVEKLAGDMKFVEGPVWIPGPGDAAGYLIFSDIPANQLKKWTPARVGTTIFINPDLGVFREPSNQANGNTLDRQGRLLTCEHASRRVTRTDLKTGEVKVLCETFEGKKLNSPNDIVEKSDGSLWFTDPPYGLPDMRKGKEQARNRVYRLDPQGGEPKAVAEDFECPNGLAFSPDEKRLYIADSGKPHHVRVFDLNADGTLANGKVFCVIDKGVPDGMRVDQDGRLFTTAGDGVRVYLPDGAFAGLIPVPESPANCCFGGADGKTLFITARKSLYAVKLLVTGASMARKP
jgi:gluconolactonase